LGVYFVSFGSVWGPPKMYVHVYPEKKCNQNEWKPYVIYHKKNIYVLKKRVSACHFAVKSRLQLGHCI